MSEDDDKVEKIGRVTSAVSGTDKVGRFSEVVPNREYFDHLMDQKVQKDQQLETARVEETKKPSPMEEVQNILGRIKRGEPPTLDKLIAQLQRTSEQFDSVKRKLATPNLELKKSVQNVLRSKLSHINESLKIALSKVGIDYVPPDKPKGLQSPIQQFLGYLTHGQSQVESLSAEAQRLQDNKDQLSAGALI